MKLENKYSQFSPPDECPRYRVRLFLAADLSNSTAYKSSRALQDWVPTFRGFYSVFTGLFSRTHLNVSDRIQSTDNTVDLSSLRSKPHNFWKTVGEEIIFVNTLSSYHEVCVLVIAFSEASKEYPNDLENGRSKDSLGIKKLGWVASFPYPNIAIGKPQPNAGDNSDIAENERVEASADIDPSQHEFLGKGSKRKLKIKMQYSMMEFRQMEILSSRRLLPNELSRNLTARKRLKPQPPSRSAPPPRTPSCTA